MLCTTEDEVKMIYLEYDFKGLNVKIIQDVKFLIIYQYLWLYVLLKDKKKSLSPLYNMMRN